MSLNPLQRWFKKSLSGVKHVHLILPGDVLDYAHAPSRGGVRPNDPKAIVDAELDPGSGGFGESLVDSIHGDRHDQVLSFTSRKLSNHVVDFRRRLMNRKVDAIVEDLNCQIWVFRNLRLRLHPHRLATRPRPARCLRRQLALPLPPPRGLLGE